MKVIVKSKRFPSLIPPIPCSVEMRKQINEIALSQEVSVAEVVRFAISKLFDDWERLEAETSDVAEAG